MTGGEKRETGGVALPVKQQKLLLIHRALTSDPVHMETLRAVAVSDGGLLSQEIRRKVWPKLLNINIYSLPPKPGPALRANHRDYNQVEMDVRRSLRRFPKGMAEGERSVLQGQLTDMILYVLHHNPQLHYYQGYHDIAVTLLLTAGVRMATAMLQTLSTHHLRDFMDPTMDRTRHVLSYLMPLVQCESPRLHDFLLRSQPVPCSSRPTLEQITSIILQRDLPTIPDYSRPIPRSEVGCIFALSWLITWYGHVLTDYHQVLRLYDFFLASHPLMPVYCAAQMVLMREAEILECECDLPSVHQLLSNIPPNFPYQTLISRSHASFHRHRPQDIERHASLQRLRSISAASFRSLEISASRQRPDSLLRQREAPPRADVVVVRSQNTLVKLAVWGLSASLGAAALAVTQTALEWGPELLLSLF